MKPLFHATLVNPPTGDAGLFVELMFKSRALLFDIGNIERLPNRKILHISDVFVSHTHMDHFSGLDHLVRICLGRDKRVRLYGPPGFIEQVEHKLLAYTWNLVRNYESDFTLSVTEVDDRGLARNAEFHGQKAFQRGHETDFLLDDHALCREPEFTVRYAMLDHRIPSLAFTLEEGVHVNVWKNKLEDMHLPVGPWLAKLKGAVLADAPPDTPIEIGATGHSRPLYELQEVLRVVPGQKLAYVADAAGHAENARRIVRLIRGADTLYIESPFLHRDRALADRKYHLTARQAGNLARRAGVRQVIPFHFSSRYSGNGTELTSELETAFRGHS